MSMNHETIEKYDVARTGGAEASPGNGLHGAFRRYENSSIPLGLKWSVSIAALIVTAMGVLGFYLIQQQEQGYRSQVDRFSHVIVDQLVRISGEPLMASDTLSLQVLLQRHAQSSLILGASLHDADRVLLVDAGVSPPGAAEPRFAGGGFSSWDWDNGEYKAVSYVSPVVYQDVTAGFLTVSIDRSPLEHDLQVTLRVLIVSTLLLIFVGVILASLLAHRLSRPIQRLAKAGEALSAGRTQGLVARRDEIGQVLKGETNSALGGNRVTGSVLFCDIVGFTELSEEREPGEVAALLNDYFGYFALAAESCGGTVDKFIGDCIMIVFGVPAADPHHALHAMTCGMLIQQLTRRINQIRQSRELATVTLRVGISSGPMQAGNLGSADRMQYTVVGDTVNVAARLCGMSEPGGVLVTEAVMATGQPGELVHYAPLGSAELRGRKENVEVRAMDVDAVAHDVNADQLIETILSTGGE
jgi:adenylate cyclase